MMPSRSTHYWWVLTKSYIFKSTTLIRVSRIRTLPSLQQVSLFSYPHLILTPSLGQTQICFLLLYIKLFSYTCTHNYTLEKIENLYDLRIGTLLPLASFAQLLSRIHFVVCSSVLLLSGTSLHEHTNICFLICQLRNISLKLKCWSWKKQKVLFFDYYG